MRVAAIAAMLALACTCVAGVAVGGEAIVVARQASMKEMAAAAKTMAGMFDGKLAFDATAFKAAAETIRARAGPALIAEFPSKTPGTPSGARPEIDQARPEFEALANHLEMLASILVTDVTRSPAAISDAMRRGPPIIMDGGSLLGKRPGMAEADPAKLPAEHVLHLVLQDCSSCHAKFRQKLE